jgi:biotin synthase
MLHCGRKVFFRGIIEFSNVCTCDCYYCGLRRSNRGVGRYQLAKGEILRQARWFADRGFGSVVLQSGQRRDPRFVGFLTDVVRSVKRETRSAMLPEGLGITLSVGEQSPDDYGRFFDAGAHRYLLNIETSSPRLFRRWHPENQAYDSRRRCLEYLRSIGFQVGTGVMIGAPWQTAADLAADVAFFKDMDVDMIGMVPYIPHPAAPLAAVDGGHGSGAPAARLVGHRRCPSGASGCQYCRYNGPADPGADGSRKGHLLRRQHHHAPGHGLRLQEATHPV